MGDYCKSTLELMTVDWDIVVLGVTAADDDDDGGDGKAAPSSPLSPPLRHFTPVNNTSSPCLPWQYELEQNHPFCLHLLTEHL